MTTKIWSLAICEVRSVTRFLKAKKVHPAEIHRRIVEVCGERTISKGMRRNGAGYSKKAGLMCMTRNDLARQKFKWKIVEHPPNIPELSPSDYHLFLRLKELLARQSLWGDQDTKDVVQEWLNVLAATFCDEHLQKPVPRYDKCLNLHGDYVEKQFNVGTSTLH